MNKALRVLLLVAYAPVFVLGFVVVHEMGHTLAARVLGDPDSTFYLVRITEQSTCLGCNITDVTRLTRGENVAVSLAGLFATQLLALLLLAAGTLLVARRFLSRLLAGSAVVAVAADVLVQGSQGLLYDIADHTWPTNVDLMDVMLLVRQQTAAGQTLMKVVLAAALALWVAFFSWLYRRSARRRARGVTPAPE